MQANRQIRLCDDSSLSLFTKPFRLLYIQWKMLKYFQINSVVSLNYIVVSRINTVVSWIYDDDKGIHPDILNNFPSFYNVTPFLNGRNCGYQHKFFTSELLNTFKQHYTYFHNFPYLCAFITIPYKEWPKKRPYTYAQIVDKTHPNGWANARRADNGTLM